MFSISVTSGYGEVSTDSDISVLRRYFKEGKLMFVMDWRGFRSLVWLGSSWDAPFLSFNARESW